MGAEIFEAFGTGQLYFLISDHKKLKCGSFFDFGGKCMPMSEPARCHGEKNRL
ncbi:MULTISPECIES: hypothetical protein [Eubacterium]|uniref:hypothetical protein n=1 Tax=Eubacterium TaxID=1730 RepID=UPI0013149184|nr:MULTISPECIES: hypothetical protein [Eubacterium]